MLKEIGESLQEKRLAIGISIDEVASDLKIDALIIENLEAGNQKVFQDILELKEITIAYAKYLGFSEEEITDDLNDYLFEKTSKISLDDIKKELEKDKDKEKTQEVKIHSPYTTITKEKNNRVVFVLIVVLLVIAVLVLLYFILSKTLIN